MYSYQIVDWGQPLQRRERANPEPKGSEVLLRVTSSGVCHSDLHIWHGYFDLGGGQKLKISDRGMKLPFTLGHEVLGEVIAKGPDAGDVAIGDKRIVYPWIGCGECRVCTEGHNLLCLKPRIIGTWVDGGYSDHVIVPDTRWLVPYDGIAEELACTYACSGITAYRAMKLTRAREDEPILIIGAGGVGLQGVHLAPSVASARRAVADVSPEKREAARSAGAALVVDNSDPQAVQAVKDWSSGGVTAVVDFVGRPETVKFAMDCSRKGGAVIIVGLFGDQLPMPLATIPLRMLRLQGSYVGTLRDLKDVVALAQEGKLPPLKTQTRPLDEVNAALVDLEAGKVDGRIVLKP
ncbi:MAG: alcohol dehydrogenase [Pseudomonadota bacterium]